MINRQMAGIAAALAVLALDQISKIMILGQLGDRAISVLPVFNLVLVWNHGVSFGLFNHGEGLPPVAFIAVSLVIAAAFGAWLLRAENRLLAVAIGMVIGGAAGNIIDRAWHGAVVDFLDFHINDLHWPAFNIADSGIVIGIALVVIDSLFSSGRKAKPTTV